MSARIRDCNSAGGIRKHPTGWPLQTVCLSLATTMYCLTRLRWSRGDKAAGDKGTLCLMPAIILTRIALCPVGIRVGQHSPAWEVLLRLLPGAIRPPQRIRLVLNIGVVIVCMFGFEKLRKALAGRGAWSYLVPVLLGCALLAEQLNFMPTHVIDREADRHSSTIARPRCVQSL